MLFKYDWPGNVRELEHVLGSSIIFVEGEKIKLENLPVYLGDKTKDIDDGKMKKTGLESQNSFDDIIKKKEISLIEKSLNESGGNITKAADQLSMTRQRLRYKIDKYKIELE